MTIIERNGLLKTLEDLVELVFDIKYDINEQYGNDDLVLRLERAHFWIKEVLELWKKENE